MNSNSPRLLATAAFTLFLVATALPVPHARAVEVCQQQYLIDYQTSRLPLKLDPLYPTWPQGPAWGPYPPESILHTGTEAGYDGECVYTHGSFVNALHDAGQPDSNGDGMGDDWAQQWAEQLGEALLPTLDADHDNLLNFREFQWELTPACIPALGILNRQDGDGDSWTDGAEVAYWNNPQNDLLLQQDSFALYDPDRLVDLDGDSHRNTQDVDSDNDTLADGVEVNAYGTYPEFTDSDCPITETSCPTSPGSTYYAAKEHQPGKGDGLNDGAELAAWNRLGASKWNTDFDGDGIANNLLDADADGDGLLDGEEFLLGKGQVRPDVKDTDGDGLPDGDDDGVAGNEEVAWSEDTDLDGFVNANDVDSDNDGMPDAWEVQHSFNMVDPSDALLDRDGDGLSNLGEYVHATDPNNMDTEGDLLLDGAEVNTHHTDPLFWDTDHDSMPDRYETQNGLNPLSAADASQDLDVDSFDRNGDGVFEQAWPNLAEYQYERPAGYNEASDGPWLLGTTANAADTDHDTAQDGYEVYYGTDPRIPADVSSDSDGDGLNWTQEAQHGTDPDDADTDGDGRSEEHTSELQ